MSWVYVGVGAVTLVGGAISSNGAKGAASKAADANARSVADTNALNQRLFEQSRGAPGDDGYGHSILPVYFGGNEEDLGKQAYNNFQRLSGLGDQSFGNLQGYQSALRPAAMSGLQALSNRYNGQDLAQRQAFADPYFQSRLSSAGTYGQGLRQIAAANNSGINTGLSQSIAQLNAQRSAQGFFGGSTYDRNRLLAATMGARQAGAVGTAQANAGANNALADANMQNASDLRAMQMSDLDFRSRLDALPAGMSALSGYESAPANALASYFNTATQPLNYFRLSPQAFQAQTPPMQEPGINNQMILGSAVQQAAGTYGNYMLGQQLASRYGSQPGYLPSASSVSSQYGFNSSGSMAPNYSLLGGSGTGGGGYPGASAPPSYFNYQYQPTGPGG